MQALVVFGGPRWPFARHRSNRRAWALVAPMDIRFGDHPSFHRAAAGMVGASAALGLGLHAIAPTTGALSTHAAAAPLVAGLLGIAIGTSIAYGKAKWRIAAAAAATVPF